MLLKEVRVAASADVPCVCVLNVLVACRTSSPHPPSLACCPPSPPPHPAQLGFLRPRQFQKVSSLSGGERRRLHLASVLVERPNVLILDGGADAGGVPGRESRWGFVNASSN